MFRKKPDAGTGSGPPHGVVRYAIIPPIAGRGKSSIWYNGGMHVFLRGLFQRSGKYWLLVACLVLAALLSVDLYSSGRLFGSARIWIVGGALAIGLGGLSLRAARDERRRKLKAAALTEALGFESRREAEWRSRIAADPEFATLCWQCTWFDPQRRCCGREYATDPRLRRVKHIQCGQRRYCLYWNEIVPPH